MMEHQLFSMLEEHIQLAKNTNTAQQKRDHIVAAKTLCELLLSEQTNTIQPVSQMTASSAVVAPQQPLSVGVSSILEEDDANGASIFDF